MSPTFGMLSFDIFFLKYRTISLPIAHGTNNSKRIVNQLMLIRSFNLRISKNKIIASVLIVKLKPLFFELFCNFCIVICLLAVDIGGGLLLPL